MDKFITKDKSKAMKFIFVIIMVILHTFGFPDRIAPYDYKSLFVFGGGTVESYLATGSSIVVHLFLFISGYGMSFLGEQSYHKIFGRIKKLYFEYWKIFLVFIPIGYALKIYKFDIKIFFLNFIGVISSYNAEWWFLRAYVIYMLLYPLIYNFIKKYPKLSIFLAMGVTGSGMILGKMIRISVMPNNLFFSILASSMEYFYPFICGMVVAQTGFYDLINEKLKKIKIDFRILFLILIVFMCWIEKFSYIRHAFNFIILPVFIFLLGLFNLERSNFIMKISKYSTGIWLTHSFFCYYYFKRIVFLPKYSGLILVWIIFLSVMSVKIIDCIWKIFLGKVCRRNVI